MSLSQNIADHDAVLSPHLCMSPVLWLAMLHDATRLVNPSYKDLIGCRLVKSTKSFKPLLSPHLQDAAPLRCLL